MSERTPTTLWVTPVADLGGVARHVLDATRVGIPGWRSVVLCPEGPLAERLRQQGSAVTTAPFGPEAGPFTSIRTLHRVARAIRPQIVHSHLAYADIINAATPLPRGTRRFTTEHGIAGDDTVYHRSRMEAVIMRSVHRVRLSRFRGVIAVSDATRKVMTEKWHVRRPVTVIRNGVNLPNGVSRRPPDSVSGLRILSLSRLAPEKRIPELISAFSELKRTHPEATLTIGGEGILRASLEDQIGQLNLRGAVDLPGFLEPQSAMNDADVVVQLSLWENSSYTLLDAAAMGLRVVASRVGGNVEILDDRQLVSSLVPESIASAIVSSVPVKLDDENTVGHMTSHIARTYEKYSHGGEVEFV